MFDNLNDYNNMLQAQQAARFRAGHGPQPAGLAAYKAKQAAAELRELAPYSVKKDDIYSASPWHVYNDGKALCEFFATKKAAVAWIHEQKNRRETISTDAAPAASVPETDAAPEQPAAVVETPAADPAPVAVSLAQFAAAHTASDNAAKPFQNETVSFTGKLSSMTRAQAIEKVKQAGGRAYADMPAGTTLLVVGINPGEKKQAKYDKWIGQCRKITETQFLEMLASA